MIVEVKLSLYLFNSHTMKMDEGVKAYIWFQHNMEVHIHFHALATLHVEYSFRYPLDKNFDEPQNKFECCGEEKSILPPLGIEIWLLGSPACSSVTIPTELFHKVKIYSFKFCYTIVE
jgi:hypothetical protein